MNIGSVKGLTETEQLQAEITRLTALVDSYKGDAEKWRNLIKWQEEKEKMAFEAFQAMKGKG